VILAEGNEKGMKLVVEFCALWKILLENMLYLLVRRALADETVATEYPASIGVNDESRLVEGIEQDGIGGLRPDAIDAEKFFSEACKPSFSKTGKAGISTGQKETAQVLKPLGLNVEISGGPDQFSEFLFREVCDFFRIEESCPLEIGDGLFDIRPSGVLCQDGTHHNLERPLTWPPMLWAVVFKKPPVDAQQDFPENFSPKCGHYRFAIEVVQDGYGFSDVSAGRPSVSGS